MRDAVASAIDADPISLSEAAAGTYARVTATGRFDPVVEFSKIEDVLVVLTEPTPEPLAEGSE